MVDFVEITFKEQRKDFGWDTYFPLSLLQDVIKDPWPLHAKLGEYFMTFPFDPGTFTILEDKDVAQPGELAEVSVLVQIII